MKMGRKRERIRMPAAKGRFGGGGEIPSGNPLHGYERCVLCKKETDIPAGLDISQRRFYIEVAGQHRYRKSTPQNNTHKAI